MSLVHVYPGHALQALGLEPSEPPGGFSFANEERYTRETSRALYDVYREGPEGMVEILNPPMVASTSALVRGIESAAKMGIDALVTAILPEGTPGIVATFVTNLINAAVDLALEAVGTAGDIVADALGIVPIVGEIIGAIVGWIIDLFVGGTDPAVVEACYEQKIANKLNAYCPAMVDAVKPVATSAAGVTPADMFRTVAYAAHTGGLLPLTGASIYVLLCGGESQGVGLTREQYDSLLAQARMSPGGERLGLPKHVQRKMWALIQGIMSSVQDPRLGAPMTRIGDQGRALMPVLQDMLLKHYANNREGPGVWNRTLVDVLANWLGSQYTRYARCCQQEWNEAVPTCVGGTETCASRVARGVGDSFVQSVKSWENVLAEQFWDASTSSWKITPNDPSVRRALSRMPKAGVLGMSRIQAVALSDDVIKALVASQRPKWRNYADLGAGLAGAGALAYLTYEGVRRL